MLRAELVPHTLNLISVACSRAEFNPDRARRPSAAVATLLLSEVPPKPGDKPSFPTALGEMAGEGQHP